MVIYIEGLGSEHDGCNDIFTSRHQGMQAFYKLDTEPEHWWQFTPTWKWKLFFSCWNNTKLDHAIANAGVECYKFDSENGYIWLKSNDALRCWMLANPNLFGHGSDVNNTGEMK